MTWLPGWNTWHRGGTGGWYRGGTAGTGVEQGVVQLEVSCDARLRQRYAASRKSRFRGAQLGARRAQLGARRARRGARRARRGAPWSTQSTAGCTQSTAGSAQSTGEHAYAPGFLRDGLRAYPSCGDPRNAQCAQRANPARGSHAAPRAFTDGDGPRRPAGMRAFPEKSFGEI